MMPSLLDTLFLQNELGERCGSQYAQTECFCAGIVFLWLANNFLFEPKKNKMTGFTISELKPDTRPDWSL